MRMLDLCSYFFNRHILTSVGRGQRFNAVSHAARTTCRSFNTVSHASRSTYSETRGQWWLRYTV